VQTTEHHVYSITELNRAARSRLESEFGDVWVKGEISELKRAASGHIYFTLKDEECELSAVRFRSRTSVLSAVAVEAGMTALAFGRLTVYEPRGRYQFVASLIQPVGAGALQMAFERLKAKLQQEGLFDADRKRPLPRFPARIGLVTSPIGAAIRDIVSVLERRWPLAEVLLFPSAVQGDRALDELPDAVERAVRFSESVRPLDLLIVGRGGGSAEDLAAFNGERLARTIADCPIPVVAAVGHEIDFSICDFVADHRAATPTAAAEVASPDRIEIAAGLAASVAAMDRRLRALHEALSTELRVRGSTLVDRSPARSIETLAQRLDHQLSSLPRAAARILRDRASTAAHLEEVLRLSDPRLPLERGYSLTYVEGSDRPLRDASSVAAGQRLETHVARGRVRSVVEEVDSE